MNGESNSGTDRVLTYLSLLGDRDIVLDGKLLTSSRGRLPLVVTPTFFRRLHCNPTCKAVCCISTAGQMDYLCEELAFWNLSSEYREKFRPVTIDVNGKEFSVFRATKTPKGTKPDVSQPPDSFCPLAGHRPEGGFGCTLHVFGIESKPLLCHTSLEFVLSEIDGKIVRLCQRGLGRSWRYDPAPMCEFKEGETPAVEEKIPMFERLMEWTRILRIESPKPRLDRLIRALHVIQASGEFPRENLVFE